MDRPQASRDAGWGRLAVSYLPVQFTASSVPVGMAGREPADQLARLRSDFANEVPRIGEKIACLLSPFGHGCLIGRQLLAEGQAGRNLPAAAIGCAVGS